MQYFYSKKPLESNKIYIEFSQTNLSPYWLYAFQNNTQSLCWHLFVYNASRVDNYIHITPRLSLVVIFAVNMIHKYVASNHLIGTHYPWFSSLMSWYKNHTYQWEFLFIWITLNVQQTSSNKHWQGWHLDFTKQKL